MIKEYYKKHISISREEHNQVRRLIYYTGSARLFIVLVTGGLIYWFRDQGSGVLFVIFLPSVLLFLWLVLKSNQLKNKKAYLEMSVTCDESEIKALNHDFSSFDGGNEKINEIHPFSLDLDIFGNNSLFQSINRTCTTEGKRILAQWFENPLHNKQDIELRQEAIRELTKSQEFIHHFRVTGLINPGKSTDAKELQDFSRKKSFFRHKKIWENMTLIFPIVWLILILLPLFINVPFFVYTWVYIICLIISESQFKKINNIQQWIGKKIDILTTYSALIQAIEHQEVESEQLIKQKAYFSFQDKQASTAIRQLARLSGELDQRSNFLVHILFNPVMLWDINKSLKIEKWKETYGSQLDTWIKALGQFDALCSFGTFSFNHPEYPFPVISENYFELNGKSLGHPLMPEDICVKNDIHIASNPYFMIVTGANMAGKSTYLRTIGVNFLLACTGAPVCAESLQLYPAALVTSLRTSDSLSNNESYFFAELKRLKMIIDRLDDGEQLFIILDEILKGTNSADKQKGSLALLKQLITLNSCGIIATHDLLLGSLEKEFPANVRNYCFEADIAGNELSFSYRLRGGIAQNMNACFLMEKMGIILKQN